MDRPLESSWILADFPIHTKQTQPLATKPLQRERQRNARSRRPTRFAYEFGLPWSVDIRDDVNYKRPQSPVTIRFSEQLVRLFLQNEEPYQVRPGGR